MGEATTIAGEVPVTLDADAQRSSIDSRRADVVRRLLDRGVSPVTLAVLLPEFSDTIANVRAGH